MSWINTNKEQDLDEVRRSLQNKQLTYSQCLQDVFALVINDYKFSGTCLDIGAGGPKYFFNNSLLLQLYDWKVVSADIGDWALDWVPYPNNTYNQADCTNHSSVKYILSQMPTTIDFLSLDIDDPTLEALELIDLDKYKFKCIAIEHNKYLGARGFQRFRQREILSKAGYHLLVKNWNNFEDWWIHPDLVDHERFKYFEDFSGIIFNTSFAGEDKFAPKHLEKIERDRAKFNKETLELL